MNQLVPSIPSNAPALVHAAGVRAQTRFWEFFVLNIRDPHARRAYARAVSEFLAWCVQHCVASIAKEEQIHASSYIWKSTLG